MEEVKPPFDIYDPYDPQPPRAIAERLVKEPAPGYVKVSSEGERILEQVTVDKNRLDILVDQYGASAVLVQTSSGFDVYVPEILAKGKRSEDY